MKKLFIITIMIGLVLPQLLYLFVPGYFSNEPVSNDPVEYSESLKDGEKCYIDVVEITPTDNAGWMIFHFFKCTLSDGSSVWMKIDSEDYVSYFDPEADKYYLNYQAKKITYETPVRLMGYVDEVTESLELYSEEKISLKLFYFDDADVSQNLQEGTKSNASIKFDPKLKKDIHVYLDIVEIKKVLYNSGNRYTVITADGDEVVIEMWSYQYNESIDSDDVGTSFTAPVRIYGLTKYADEEGENSDTSEPKSSIFSFKYADTDSIEANKITNLEPVPFDEADAYRQPAYVDVVEMIPYGKQDVSNLLYQCVLDDGSCVWLKISHDDYIDHFDSEAEYSETERDCKKMDFSVPLRLLGNIEYCDIFKDNYSEEKTNVKMLVYTGYKVMQETKYEIYNTGVKFDPNMRNNVLVYEDIIGLLPKYTISQLGVNHTYLCQGITSEAKTVWVLISISDYEDYFDSENDLTLPYRIYGGTVYADDEFADINISGAEGFDEVSSLLFYFTELEVEEEG